MDLTIYQVPSGLLDTEPPDVYSGYVRMDLDWLDNLAYDLGYWVKPSRQELWQLMFLCDMKHYQLHGRGYTGLRYQATSNGPAVLEEQALLDRLISENIVRIMRRSPRDAKGPQRITGHSYYYPPDLQANSHAEDVMRLLGLRPYKKDHPTVLHECQRAPLWDRWVADRAFIPYDIAFSMQL